MRVLILHLSRCVADGKHQRVGILYRVLLTVLLVGDGALIHLLNLGIEQKLHALAHKTLRKTALGSSALTCHKRTCHLDNCHIPVGREKVINQRCKVVRSLTADRTAAENDYLPARELPSREDIVRRHRLLKLLKGLYLLRLRTCRAYNLVVLKLILKHLRCHLTARSHVNSFIIKTPCHELDDLA